MTAKPISAANSADIEMYQREGEKGFDCMLVPEWHSEQPSTVYYSGGVIINIVATDGRQESGLRVGSEWRENHRMRRN